MMINTNVEYRNTKQILNKENSKRKNYDLEDRTLKFAEKAAVYVNNLPRSISNSEVGRQLVRSAGSVGANYIEANEALSKKDCSMRMKISRKEAKESRYWARLTFPAETGIKAKKELVQESTELMNIFGAILKKLSEPSGSFSELPDGSPLAPLAI